MQFFRRDKQDDEAKAAGKSQATDASSWYENAGQRPHRNMPYPAQPAEVTDVYDNQPAQRPFAPAPASVPSAVMSEQTRSMPAMSNIARENLPYPDLPMQGGSRQARPTGQATVIDAQSHFSGNYRSDSDLIIEGTFEGEIECNGTVTVAENATLSATVKARNVVVAGSANGEITCDERFTVRATGEMRGKALSATLVVEEGAFFEGEFRMGNSYSAPPATSYSGWESARKAPAAATEYSMSVDESDLADMDEMDAAADPFSVDDLWDSKPVGQ